MSQGCHKRNKILNCFIRIIQGLKTTLKRGVTQIKAQRQITAGNTWENPRPSAWLEHEEQEGREVKSKARG